MCSRLLVLHWAMDDVLKLFSAFVVILTGRDGRISKLEQVYLRGGQIKFVVLPEALKSSSIFKRVQQLSKAKKDTEATAGRGGGRGRSAKRQKVA